MRHLASIKTIRDLKPIANADKIECAVIDGYNCVVKKGEFVVGDFCVYCENDSILPKNNPNFAFLEGKRIKIKRLRGVYSYGIAFPLNVLPTGGTYNDGDDVAELLGVTKWEPVIFNSKQYNHTDNIVRAPYPSWIPQTDETRFQAIIDVLKDFVGTDCIVTEKLDGASTTHWLDEDGNYHVASRNREIVDTSEVFYRGAVEANIPQLLQNLPRGTVVQGELIGNGIAGNKYKIDGYKIYMFNLRSADTKKFVNPIESLRIMRDAGFDVVPVVHDKWRLVADVEKLIELSIGKSKLNPQQHREGIVVRPLQDIYVEDIGGYFVDGRLSFKVINPKFELEVK